MPPITADAETPSTNNILANSQYFSALKNQNYLNMLLNHSLNIENVDFEGISMVLSEILDDCVAYEVENNFYLAMFFHPMS